MKRSALAGRLVLIAILASTLSVPVLPLPAASAATGDVLTMETFNGVVAQSLSTTSAGFTPHDPVDAFAASGAEVAFSGGPRVTIAPPKGAQFASGITYQAAVSPSESAAGLDVWSTLLTDNCPSTLPATYSATVRVLAAAYGEDGRLTELAADFAATCVIGGVTERVAGSVRHASSTPWFTLAASYPDDDVPLDLERTSDVVVRGTGSAGGAVVLGEAVVSGRRAADYTVVDNGCEGVRLTDNDSCHVSVRFKPLAASNEPTQRIALLTIAAPGHAAGAVRAVLDSRATRLPDRPRDLSTFPVAGGVGVSWYAGDAETYVLERRADGAADWTPLATVHTVGGDGTSLYIDRDTPRSATVSYRVTPNNRGWEGEPAITSTTRLDADPVPTARRLISLVSHSADPDQDASLAIAGDDPGATFTILTSEIRAELLPPSGSVDPHTITFSTPAIPSPGIYRDLNAGARFESAGCQLVSGVLIVRNVLYDERRTPLVLDASWVGICTDGTARTAELRIGTDTGISHWSADPISIGRLASHHGGAVGSTVTIANTGDGPQMLGRASVHGEAAVDWTVLDDGCAGRTLASGETCSVGVSFVSTADGGRPAVLEVTRSDATGALAPASVLLDGWGATPPGAPIGDATGTIGAILLSWRLPDDGGLPVQRFQIERRVGTTGWQPVASVANSAHPSWVDLDPPAHGQVASYRVRGVNDAGAGPWQTVGFEAARGSRAVLVSAREGDTGPRGIYQLTDGVVDTPVVPLTDDPAHDYRTPDISPGGNRIAVSVSTSDGADGEYDLWTGPLRAPKSVRLTDRPGTERHPAWAPDAKLVAFTAVDHDGHRSVWTVPAGGGTPRLVRDRAAHPAWTPDGTRLVVEDDSTPDAPLLLVDPTSGAAADAVPGSADGSQPAVAPSGAIAWINDPTGAILVLNPGASAPVNKAQSNGIVFGNPTFTDRGDLRFDETATADGANPDRFSVLLNDIVEPEPFLEDSEQPFAFIDVVGDQDVVNGTAQWTVKVSDDLTPQWALLPQCRVDELAWVDCRDGGTAAGLNDGWHRVSVRVADLAGHVVQTGATFYSDTVRPKVSVTGPTQAELSAGTGTFRWVGTDEGPAELAYDVTITTSSPTKAPTAFARPAGWGDAEPRTSLVVRPGLGTETCVRVRARDGAGQWSAATTRCATRALDDASLKAGKGWKHKGVTGSYRSTETVAARKGATLRTATVQARRIGVLVTTCKGCGSVRVYLGSRFLGSISLASPRTAHQQLKYLPLLSKISSGVLTVKTRSSRTVRVDGVVLARN